MLGEGADCVALLGIGVGIARPDDDRAEAAVVAAICRQHRGRERRPVHVAQRQEQRHLALDVRLQPDLLLEIDLRHRAEALRRLVLLLAEVLLDGVTHRFRFGDRLGLGFDPKPGLAPRRIANIAHASSTWVPAWTGIARVVCDVGTSKILRWERVNSKMAGAEDQPRCARRGADAAAAAGAAEPGSVHSRHSATSAAITAGPRNRPRNPIVCSPPRIPSRTNRKGSRVAPPIRNGRTKWSATNTTTLPKANTTIAPTVLPSVNR